MGNIVKFVAIVAACGVLWVLITPAVDELDSTAAHKPYAMWALAAGLPPVALLAMQLSSPPIPSARLLTASNVLVLTCVCLC